MKKKEKETRQQKQRFYILAGIIILIAGIFLLLFALTEMYAGIFPGKAVEKIPTTLPKEATQIKSTLQTANNNLISLNSQYQVMKDKKAKMAIPKLNQLKKLAQQRRALMEQLMKKNPKLAVDVAIASEEYKRLPPEIQKLTEKKETVTGRFIQDHEDAADGTSKDFLYLQSQGQKIPFYPVTIATKLTNQLIRTSGISLEKVGFATAQIQLLQEPVPSTGTKTVAVLLLSFPDTDSITPEIIQNAQNIVFNDPTSSARTFFEESSYSTLSIDGYVLVVNMPNPLSSYAGLIASDFSAFGQEVITSADAQVDWSQVDHIVAIYGGDSCSGKGNVGTRTYNSQEGPFEASFAQVTSFDYLCTFSSPRKVAHELAHGFGHHHAAGWQCPTIVGSSLGDPFIGCSIENQGDKADIMGKKNKLLSLSRKEYSGWLQPSNTLTIAQSGTYLLGALEIPGSEVKHLKIPLGEPGYYSIEYRRFTGFDALYPDVLEGVLIRYIPSNLVLVESSYVSSLWPNDIILSPSVSFSDPFRNIQVSVLSQSESSAEILITLSPCSPEAEICDNIDNDCDDSVDEEGVCTLTCEDSDGGPNFLQGGTTTGGGIFYDSCDGSASLLEYFCGPAAPPFTGWAVMGQALDCSLMVGVGSTCIDPEGPEAAYCDSCIMEYCDGVDNDCDGQIDEDSACLATCVDNDNGVNPVIGSTGSSAIAGRMRSSADGCLDNQLLEFLCVPAEEPFTGSTGTMQPVDCSIEVGSGSSCIDPDGMWGSAPGYCNIPAPCIDSDNTQIEVVEGSVVASSTIPGRVSISTPSGAVTYLDGCYSPTDALEYACDGNQARTIDVGCGGINPSYTCKVNAAGKGYCG